MPNDGIVALLVALSVSQFSPRRPQPSPKARDTIPTYLRLFLRLDLHPRQIEQRSLQVVSFDIAKKKHRSVKKFGGCFFEYVGFLRSCVLLYLISAVELSCNRRVKDAHYFMSVVYWVFEVLADVHILTLRERCPVWNKTEAFAVYLDYL